LVPVERLSSDWTVPAGHLAVIRLDRGEMIRNRKMRLIFPQLLFNGGMEIPAARRRVR
jgi:hypothetical protein